MFNDNDYRSRLAAVMLELHQEVADPRNAGIEPAWCDTVSLRYGQFLVETVRNRLTRFQSVKVEVLAEHSPDRAAYLAHCANDMRDAAGILYNAAMLFSGSVSVADPVRCEAEMRLLEATSWRPAPEADAALRGRLIEELTERHMGIEAGVHTATGADLDVIAKRYGLFRTGL